MAILLDWPKKQQTEDGEGKAVPRGPRALSQSFFLSLCITTSLVFTSEDLAACLDICAYQGGLVTCAWAPYMARMAERRLMDSSRGPVQILNARQSSRCGVVVLLTNSHNVPILLMQPLYIFVTLPTPNHLAHRIKPRESRCKRFREVSQRMEKGPINENTSQNATVVDTCNGQGVDKSSCNLITSCKDTSCEESSCHGDVGKNQLPYVGVNLIRPEDGMMGCDADQKGTTCHELP